MSYVQTAVVVIKTLTLILGGLITYLSFKAYRRTGSPSLRALSIGFGIVTLGAILAGVMDQLSPFGLAYSVALESSLTLLGFAVIIYSLYVE
ncbi:hypothetical protein ACFQJD_11690 [Haloplanus sp. GCM10025708]|uniref:DUF7521 family protein n=1 Tax=Haloferacaceae TaxID=1644056 RepID=UPI00360C98B1